MTKHILPNLPPGSKAYEYTGGTIVYGRGELVSFGNACAEATRKAAIAECMQALIACDKKVTFALAAILQVPTPDKIFNLNAIPRDPVLTQVSNIHDAMLACRKALK